MSIPQRYERALGTEAAYASRKPFVIREQRTAASRDRCDNRLDLASRLLSLRTFRATLWSVSVTWSSGII
jgi:hypothetical protein